MKAAKKSKSSAAAATPAPGDLLATLQARFELNLRRHPDVTWAQVKARLDAAPAKLRTLAAMEKTGGEPDVVSLDAQTGEVVFFDCAAESPTARHSVCFDREALNSRKEHKPKNSAIDMAAEIGAELLTEAQYRELQKLGEFDTRTSSWLQTPADIRYLGGALFGDRRFNHVFIYHNGAQSYYSGRGFRCALRV